MDTTGRNARIEQAFPDGIAETGFSYMFSTHDVPDGMVMFEVKMPNETLRLFFEKQQFKQFALEANIVATEISS